MFTQKFLPALTATLIGAVLLTGCSSVVRDQHVPSAATPAATATATATPGAEAPVEAPGGVGSAISEATPLALDIPADVTAAFPDTSALAASVTEILALTQGGMPQFYAARTDAEEGFYEMVRPYMTDAQYEKFVAWALSDDPALQSEADALVPTASRDGVWGIFDGVEYSAVDAEASLAAVLAGEATVALSVDETGAVEGVSVTTPLTVFVKATPENLVYGTQIELVLVPGSEQPWIVASFWTTSTADVTVES